MNTFRIFAIGLALWFFLNVNLFAQFNLFAQYEACSGSSCAFNGLASSACGTSQVFQTMGLNFSHLIQETNCDLGNGEGHSTTNAFVNASIVDTTIRDLLSASIPFAFRSEFTLQNFSMDCDITMTIAEQSTSRFAHQPTEIVLAGQTGVNGVTSASRHFILPEAQTAYFNYSTTQDMEVTAYSMMGQSNECQYTANVEIQLLITDQFATDNGIVTQPVLTWAGTPIKIRKECAKVVELQSDTLDSYIYSARDTLFSSSIIPTGGVVEFRSNQDIILEAGFEIEAGADFVVSDYVACL